MSTSADESENERCLFIESKVEKDGYITIIAEAFRPSYAAIRPTLTALAEAISRPSLIHEYRLTPFSLGAAVSSGISPAEAIQFLMSHTYGWTAAGHQSPVIGVVQSFIESCMKRYHLARLVVEAERTFVQCSDAATAEALLRDAVIQSVVKPPGTIFYENSFWKEEQADYPSFLLQSRAVSKVVAARCVVLGLPIQQQYDYERDTTIRRAYFSLRTQTKPRQYQTEAVEAAAGNGTLNSGCLLLPCGAGKTLLGIMVMCKVKKPTLVLCAGSVSVEQWRNQILDYATLEAPPPDENETAVLPDAQPRQLKHGAARIACLTGKQKDPITEETDVVLTTYSMLVSAHRAQARKVTTKSATVPDSNLPGEYTESDAWQHKRRKQNPKEKLFAPYGLLILDEVHVIPAEAFRESLSFIDAKGIIGLTATYVREDHKIMDLFHLVGPKLYDTSMESLASQGYLATVNCIEVHTSMTKEFGLEYMNRCTKMKGGTVGALIMLAAANPNKMMCVRELVHRHLEGGSKILVFCDHIALLKEYGRLLHAPVICGSTQHKDRLMIFSDFQSTSKVNVICVSRVGDVSVNLPNANVVIQVSSHGGSRRQEAQRLGRILRPKERAANGKPVEAWFYSVISMDTLEMSYAAHRTAFLVDQGYACRIMEYNPDKIAMTDSSNVKSQVKEDRVGDTVSIKQEHLHDAMHQSRLLHSSLSIRGVNNVGADELASLSYQLRLLSKMVSSWEIEFQQECRKRKRTTDGGAAEMTGDVADDEDVVQIFPHRGYDAIKREYASSPAVERHAMAPLHHLVGVDDGFVYHEL